MYAIGIDIGTGSVKAIAADTSGCILASTNITLSRSSPHQGMVEQDAVEVKAATFQALNQLLNSLEMHGKPSCISFSAAMHSMLAINTAGQPITKAMLWADARSIAQSDTISNLETAQELYVQTGVPTHPMLPLCKVIWLRENDPAIFKQAYKFISLKEYVFHACTNEYVVDFSIATASGFFDIKHFQWNENALALAGISASQLSTPVPYSYNTKMLPNVASGLLENVPIIVGSSDGVLATIGSGAIENDSLSLTIGTSAAVRMLSTAAWAEKNPKLFSYAIAKHQFLVGGAINNGGMAADWFTGWFGKQSNATSLLDEALQLAPTCNRPVCLPYFAGERAPVWNAGANGVFVGITMQQTPAHFLRAIVEGICFSLFQCAEPLMKLHHTHTIVASGGFILNEAWLQLLADIFNKRVVVKDDKDASAIGAIIIGFEAIGQKVAFESACIKTFEPNTIFAEVYQKRYAIFKELYSMHHHHFSILNSLQA